MSARRQDRKAAGIRIFEGHRVLCLPSGALDRAVELLAAALRPVPIDLLVGVARGGQVPAARLAAALDRPVGGVRARHNRGDGIRSSTLAAVEVGSIDHLLGPAIRRMLVIDDIWGTGTTMRAVTERLRNAGDVERVWTVTLCRNDGGRGWPDWYVWPVREWVVFPWEPVPAGEPVEDLPVPVQVRRPPAAQRP